MELLISVAGEWFARPAGQIHCRIYPIVVAALTCGILLVPRTGAGQELRPLEAEIAAGDRYGYSVAIDGGHILVGSPHADDFGTSSGGVSFFGWNNQTWGEARRLEAGDVTASDQFGWDVSVDGSFAVVGTYTGAAYIFQWMDTTWVEQAVLTADGGGQNDRFGHAVDISGDYAIVGAYGTSVADTMNDAGAAYIFVRGSNGWERDTTLTAPAPTPGDHFGYSVSLDGMRAIVGARGRDVEQSSNTGAAYIFERSAGEWRQEAVLTAAEGAEGDEFGFSVDIFRDRVLVGAWNDDTEATDAGAAYSFTRSSSGWDQERKWTSGDTSAVDAGYGFAVAIDSAMAVIGAIRGNGWDSQSGVAYLYEHGESWDETRTFAPDSVRLFGSSVDVDAESGVLIGAWGTDDNAGSAWLYSFTPETPVARHDPELPREATLAQNYPNPFNPTTTIPYHVSSTGHVQLAIYDARGRLIATPVNRRHTPGRYTVEWQARNQPSGTYFYRLSVNARHQTRSMILLK